MTIRVLVVDDSATIRHMLTKLLTEADMEVSVARNGNEALDQLGPGHPFDVVVSDLKMPGLDGRTLVTTLQKHDELSSLPVAILTSSEEAEDHISNLEAGALAYIRKAEGFEPVLLATVRRLAKQKTKHVQLERDSRTDPLTKLFNRRYGGERLAMELERHRRHGHDLAVAMLDIDHFKKINDTLGHSAGDDVLVRVASELRGVSRGSDVVVRWGGEEFLFAFPDTDLLAAAGIVERFRSHLASVPVTVRAANTEVPVTISGGVAACEKGDTIETLVARADSALYKAKESGRNRLLMWQLGTLRPVTAA